MANLKKKNDMAVSPVVATLVLIVVAVIGAVAVGTIMGTFSSDVSKKASAGQAGDAAASEILIAGSTTLIPAELNLASDFQRSNPGFQINVQGGGSAQGPQSVALGIADIGATSSASAITTAMSNNPNDPIYQNLYFTQVGGRGVVFVQDASKTAVPGSQVNTSELLGAYVDANGNKGKTTTATPNITATGVTMEQREAGSGTMSTAFSYLGGAAKTAKDTGFTSLPIASSNSAMYTAVKAGSATAPVIGFLDSGYAISGGVTSTTTAPGISVLNLTVSGSPTLGYYPSHANIKAALKDWYYGYAQDTTSGPNYPQGLVGGLYWVTKGSTPSAFSGNVVTEGKSTAGSAISGLINFAKSPAEAPAFNNAGMYSMYDFLN